MEGLKKIADALGSYTSAVVYVLIAALFLFGFIKCTLPVIHNRGRLRHAVRVLRGGDRKNSWQEDAFLGKGTLYSHWSEYLNNLFFADDGYHNASNVEDFINEETVIYGPGNAGFSEALPGLMVSLGFMGTLIGLAVGLSGFDMGDSEAVMSSIETLIPSMRYAFLTSIAGVIGSVAFTLITRFVSGSANRAIERFYGAMSRHAGVVSVDPMTQIAIYQQEQSALIEKLSADLNGEFANRLEGAIAQATAPLKDSLDRFVTVTSQEQMRFLDTVVTRFVSHMDQSLNGQFSRLSDVLTRTSQNQERLLSGMDSQITSVSRAATQYANLERSLTGLVDALSSQVDRMVARGQAAGDALSGMQQLQRQQTELMKQLGGMQNAVSGLDRAAKAIAGACEGIDEMQERTKADLEEVHAEALRQTDAQVGQMLEAIGSYVSDYTERMKETAAALEQSVAGLPESAERIGADLAEQAERIAAALNRAQRALDDAADRMYRH